MNLENKIYEEILNMNISYGVLSTISVENMPQSACVYYIIDKFLNIYFITRSNSRKFTNIKTNPNVSFVVTQELPPRTIQIEGKATIVTDPNEEMAYFDKLIKVATENSEIPPVSQLADGEMVFVKMETNWARLGNFQILKESGIFTEVIK